jgi:RimK family alpha-L-glutamate ligase
MTDKIWLLLSGVEQDITNLASQSPIAQKLMEQVEIILIEKASVKLATGKKPEIYYDGKKMELPKMFWPAMTNTDTYVLENILIESGSKCVLNLNEAAVAHSKVITYARLAEHNISVPKTRVFFNRSDKADICAEFSYPFVIKPDTGTGGAGVALIHNEQELEQYMDNLTYGVTYIAQEFIATSKGRDVRVVMLNGEFLFAMLRQASNEDEFRSNVHVGGKVSAYTIDEDTLAFCKKIASLYDIPLLGIDLLFGENGFVVAEVNNFPGIRGINIQYLPVVKDKVLSSLMKE